MSSSNLTDVLLDYIDETGETFSLTQVVKGIDTSYVNFSCSDPSYYHFGEPRDLLPYLYDFYSSSTEEFDAVYALIVRDITEDHAFTHASEDINRHVILISPDGIYTDLYLLLPSEPLDYLPELATDLTAYIDEEWI